MLLAREQYIAHPDQVSIQLEPSPTALSDFHDNRCFGGLRCRWHHKVGVGQLLHLTLPQIKPDFYANVQVIWRRLIDQDYELGMVFLDQQQAYQMRMLEQVCHIHCYQRWIQDTEGRKLDTEQAAMEWIQKFAAHFPSTRG